MRPVLYLAHSVHQRPRGRDIQQELEDIGYEVYNPFYPKDPRAYRNDIKMLDEGHIVPWDIADPPSADWIIRTDLRAVGNSDRVVCIYPRRRTVGIPCEMTYAWMSHIPVHSVTPPDMKGHPWIVGMSSQMSLDTEIEKFFDQMRNVVDEDV